MDRRSFIQSTLLAATLGPLAMLCNGRKKIPGRIVGASAALGHLLRNGKSGQPISVSQKTIAIVGGGVSGLSAAYHLHKMGINDFVLLDLEDRVGGNASHGANAVSAYPWGAHYVPIPNIDLTEYNRFLEETGVITGRNPEGIPSFNELHLCFDPEERLYINGHWQDGLIPHFGVPESEKIQIERFLSFMNDYRYAKGADGKDAFALPVNASSKDPQFTALDNQTMKSWMEAQGFTSTYLHNYINYCTRDDFGTPHEKASAWAGIHYFACRKGKGTNADHSDVLTWPEGNGWLVKHLQKDVKTNILTNAMATKVTDTTGGVHVDYFDVASNTFKRIDAAQCIMAVPQFVAGRLLHDAERLAKAGGHLHYVPWMVANLTVKALEQRSGQPLSWDNVIYGSKSLGYVEATHELVEQHVPKKNLTYYLPLTDGTVADARRAAHTKTHEQWVAEIIADLKKVHPNFEEAVEEINIQLWGHAMTQPLPGMIHGNIRHELSASINNRIHFAHTDLAGVSLFEEAFYQGLGAAQAVQQNISANETTLDR